MNYESGDFMLIRAVIFDIGGVLVHTVDRSRQRTWEQRLGLAEGTLEPTIWQMPMSLAANVGQASRATVWAEVTQRFALSPADAVALEEDYFSGGVWNDQLIEYARSLRACCKTGIVSNAWPDARMAVQPWVNGDAFDDLIFSAEVGFAKPNRRIYELALDRLRVRPGEAIFVDDVQANVAAAQAIGMAGIRFENTELTLAEIERCLKE